MKNIFGHNLHSWHSCPIQHADTRRIVEAVKCCRAVHNVWLVGCFAEWEYFNMDAANGSAMTIVEGMGLR